MGEKLTKTLRLISWIVASAWLGLVLTAVLDAVTALSAPGKVWVLTSAAIFALLPGRAALRNDANG